MRVELRRRIVALFHNLQGLILLLNSSFEISNLAFESTKQIKQEESQSASCEYIRD